MDVTRLTPLFFRGWDQGYPPSPPPPPPEILGELCAPGSLLLHSHTMLTIINLSPIVSSVSSPLSPPMMVFCGEPSSQSQSQSHSCSCSCSHSPVGHRTCSPHSTSPVGCQTHSMTRKMKSKGKHPPILLHEHAKTSGATSDIKKQKEFLELMGVVTTVPIVPTTDILTPVQAAVLADANSHNFYGDLCSDHSDGYYTHGGMHNTLCTLIQQQHTLIQQQTEQEEICMCDCNVHQYMLESEDFHLLLVALIRIPLGRQMNNDEGKQCVINTIQYIFTLAC